MSKLGNPLDNLEVEEKDLLVMQVELGRRFSVNGEEDLGSIQLERRSPEGGNRDEPADGVVDDLCIRLWPTN